MRLACNEVDELRRLGARLDAGLVTVGLMPAGHEVDEGLRPMIEAAIRDHEERIGALRRAGAILDAALAVPLPPAPATFVERPSVEVRYCVGCGAESRAPHVSPCRFENAAFCRCMNLDGRCSNLHYEQTLTPRTAAS